MILGSIKGGKEAQSDLSSQFPYTSVKKDVEDRLQDQRGIVSQMYRYAFIGQFGCTMLKNRNALPLSG